MSVKPIPEGYHSVTPNLNCRGAAKAIDFYKNAFGAEELMRVNTPDGKIMHAEIRIGNSVVMLADENPDFSCKSPQSLGGSPVSFFIYVENVDAVFARAVAAGATVTMPLADMFWGDRMGGLTDPFGHKWSPAQHIADLTPDQIAKGQRDFLATLKQ